jgi:hypothetical protein
MNDKEAQEIRAELEKDLRVGVPDEVWDRLVKHGLAQAVYTGGDKRSREELEQEAREMLVVYRAGASETLAPGRGEDRSGPAEIAVELDDYTRRRGEVFAELASLLPEVRRFRAGPMRGSLLTAGQADAFLKGLETGRDWLDRRRNARRDLNRLAGRLARRYGWRERAAARFVLTGRVPELLNVAVGFGEGERDYVPNTASVHVTAEIGVSVEEVAEAFKAAQRQILGGDNRKRERSLEVARFVARQIREHGKRPSWPEMKERWNEEHPRKKDRYRDYRAIRQTFVRFMRPKYKRPRFEHAPSSEADRASK